MRLYVCVYIYKKDSAAEVKVYSSAVVKALSAHTPRGCFAPLQVGVGTGHGQDSTKNEGEVPDLVETH